MTACNIDLITDWKQDSSLHTAWSGSKIITPVCVKVLYLNSTFLI